MSGNKDVYSPIDIPLSCSLLLEPALARFAHLIASTSETTKDFVHNWNCALVDVIKDNKIVLGDTGKHFISNINQSPRFLSWCVSLPLCHDMPSWALHYSIRFTESLRFLNQKQKNVDNIMFADCGSGLSPFAIIAKNEYHISDAYCIELEPQIIDLYIAAADKMGVKAPSFIRWDNIPEFASKKTIKYSYWYGRFSIHANQGTRKTIQDYL